MCSKTHGCHVHRVVWPAPVLGGEELLEEGAGGERVLDDGVHQGAYVMYSYHRMDGWNPFIQIQIGKMFLPKVSSLESCKWTLSKAAATTTTTTTGSEGTIIDEATWAARANFFYLKNPFCVWYKHLLVFYRRNLPVSFLQNCSSADFASSFVLSSPRHWQRRAGIIFVHKY